MDDYKFKYMSIDPKSGYKMSDFKKEEVAMLQNIDEALVNFREDVDQQFDQIYIKMETSRPAGKTGSSIERKEANTWLKSFFKKELTLKESGSGAALFDAMTTDSDSSGGILVPELLLAEIQHCIKDNGLARQMMRYLPFSGPGNTRRLPKETGSISVSWVDELGKKPVSSLVLDEVIQQLKKIAVITVMSDELIEDSAIDLVSYCAKRIGEAIAEEEDRVFFAGDTLAGDPFDGVINTTGVVDVPMGAGLTVADITPSDLLKMIYAIPKSGRKGAAFYVHSDIMFNLQALRLDLLTASDGLGGYLMQQPITSGQPPTIWGHPVYTLDVLPDGETATESTPFAIFANLERTCVYGDKAQLRIKLLDQATIEDAEGNSINLAQHDAQALRVYRRVGFVCTLPECISVISTGAAQGAN